MTIRDEKINAETKSKKYNKDTEQKQVVKDHP
jgi:hypothetical protein